ncbi:unnamed protein product [Arctia plantaginis]|uniref:Carboxylesterase type B domain-containing protein n=1 Tax=Arctia plantaginis TaxID=874455 RepID=A0A8S0YNV4_ARCPL|nr:unnamed protein product [Arctia plantaginis]
MSRWMYFLFLCVAVGATEHGNDEWLEVNIEQGPVRGQLDSGGELWTFLNIPYATAPTGKHKFKAPLPPPTWTKTYDAVDRRIICPQFVWNKENKDPHFRYENPSDVTELTTLDS